MFLFIRLVCESLRDIQTSFLHFVQPTFLVSQTATNMMKIREQQKGIENNESPIAVLTTRYLPGYQKAFVADC